MADKRYQVFISSTYTDLVDERRRVFDALTRIGCIPAGMELFGAMDEEQFKFITTVIDESDYYLLIIGGRYGTVAPDGLAYTEKEYDYAVNKGLKVIALLHGEPSQIKVGKTDLSAAAAKKLSVFRKKVQTGRLVDYWLNPDQLATHAITAVTNVMRVYPALGWVRANQAASVEVLTEINDIRKRNAVLESKLKEATPTPVLSNIAGLDEKYRVQGTINGSFGERDPWTNDLSWQEIFGFVAPCLQTHPNDELAKQRVAAALMDDPGGSGTSQLTQQEFSKIMLHLSALGLVRADYTKSSSGGMALFWQLTPQGDAKMLEMMVVPSKKTAPKEPAKGSPPKRGGLKADP